MLKNFKYDKTPIVEIVNDILIDASKRGASDIHFDPYDTHLKVRIRIDGELIDYTDVPIDVVKNLITRIKIISGMNITESRLPQDGAIKQTLNNINLDLRVSSLPTNNGEKIVIRILDYSLSLSGLEHLGFSQENLKKVLKMISEPNGIILVTGATGSGKSTTVYSILQKLNKENTNIISVEDPIEMNIDGINQIQTNSDIGLDFATALRSILRQDPNIIMIGEIRDTETAKIAVRASITGHLVLSTLHTNDSLNTIERLLDMEVERYLLASSLTGIISQKLARKLCTNCRKKRTTNDYEKNIIKKVTGKKVDEIYFAEGCDQCKNGYNGRIAIHEVLLIDQTIKDAISSNLRKDKLRNLVYNQNVITLLQDGIAKVLDGSTTLEELLKIIELDDDNGVSATGLANAIEANELASNKLIPDRLTKTKDIFDTPETLINNTKEAIAEDKPLTTEEPKEQKNDDMDKPKFEENVKINEQVEKTLDSNENLNNEQQNNLEKDIKIEVQEMNTEKEETINPITNEQKKEIIQNETINENIKLEKNNKSFNLPKRENSDFFSNKKKLF